MIPSVTILLLDDEPLLRRATALILARHGARVTAAGTADEAVALTRKQLYDVAVLDVSPPGPSVTEILARIRANGLVPRRVVAVSSQPLDRREAEELTQVLPRPYPFESLLRAVFGVGGRRRTRSGVFARAELGELCPQTPGDGGARVTRAAARAGRGPGG
jgi:CheY-like chemotaxis protein